MEKGPASRISSCGRCSNYLRLQKTGKKRGRNNPIHLSSPIFRSPWVLEASCRGSLRDVVHSNQPPGAQSKVESAPARSKRGMISTWSFKKYLLHYLEEIEMREKSAHPQWYQVTETENCSHEKKIVFTLPLMLVICRNRWGWKWRHFQLQNRIVSYCMFYAFWWPQVYHLSEGTKTTATWGRGQNSQLWTSGTDQAKGSRTISNVYMSAISGNVSALSWMSLRIC